MRSLFALILLLSGITIPLCGQEMPSSTNPATAQPGSPAPAATPVAPQIPQAHVPPGAIYKQAMHPLDIVRSSLDNWSNSELQALSVGMHIAREACAGANPSDYQGVDLYDLARLCALGQDWVRANGVAQEVLARGPEAYRTRAYATIVTAQVHLNDIDGALKTTPEMLNTRSYDAEVAYTLVSMKSLLAQQGRQSALALAAEEQPKILEALKRHEPLTESQGDAAVGVGDLYEMAMQYAFLERYFMNRDGAAETVASLEAAVPPGTPLNVSDRETIDKITTQYRLLGAKLPALEIQRSLFSKASKAQIDPNYGAATVLMLFPDWCVSCRAEAKTLTQFAAVNKDTPIHAYGLVFLDDFGVAGQNSHEYNLKDLEGTATLLVSPVTARILGGIDYPMGIVIDKTGVVRFAGVIPVDAFNGGGYIEKVIVRMKADETNEQIPPPSPESNGNIPLSQNK